MKVGICFLFKKLMDLCRLFPLYKCKDGANHLKNT